MEVDDQLAGHIHTQNHIKMDLFKYNNQNLVDYVQFARRQNVTFILVVLVTYLINIY